MHDLCLAELHIDQQDDNMMLICRAGQEVTISYGAWPNDVFLLFFGFLPDQNEHDAVVLFHGLPDLIACYNRMLHQSHVAGFEHSQLQSTSEQHNAVQQSTAQQLTEDTHAERQPVSSQSDGSTGASSHAQHRSNVSVQYPNNDSASSSGSSSTCASLEMGLMDNSNTPVQHSSNQRQHDSAATGSNSQSPDSAAAEASQGHQASEMQHQTPEQRDMQQRVNDSDQPQHWIVEEQHAALLEKLGPGDWSRCENLS